MLEISDSMAYHPNLRKIDLHRLTAICGGDRVLARRVAVRGLRELADDVESKKD